MANTCGSCGAYLSGWKCTNCEQTELMKKSIQQQREFATQQQEQAEKNKRAADFDARMNREMQEEQEMRTRRNELVAQMQAELEDIVKQSFAEIALLIQTNTVETIPHKFEEYCSSANAELDITIFSKTGGIFAPLRAKIYRKHFTEYIINNPAKASEIAITKSLFEFHAKTAQEVWDANEALEEEIKLQQIQRENEEQLARDATDASTAAEDKVQRRKAMYGMYFFAALAASISYIKFQESQTFVGYLCAIGAFGCLSTAMYFGLDNTSRLK